MCAEWGVFCPLKMCAICTAVRRADDTLSSLTDSPLFHRYYEHNDTRNRKVVLTKTAYTHPALSQIVSIRPWRVNSTCVHLCSFVFICVHMTIPTVQIPPSITEYVWKTEVCLPSRAGQLSRNDSSSSASQGNHRIHETRSFNTMATGVLHFCTLSQINLSNIHPISWLSTLILSNRLHIGV